MKTFKTRDMGQVTTAALWATLRSLDVANQLKSIGLANLDIVCSELVKFLLVNTGCEAITKLEAKVSELEKTKAELTKANKGAVASAATATNKVDELKKTVAGLEKRLKKLEDKS